MDESWVSFMKMQDLDSISGVGESPSEFRQEYKAGRPTYLAKS
jgi:hypothetical protein